MPPTSPQNQPTIRAPPPLAAELAGRLAGGQRVLDYAAGSGRNAVALQRAGFPVVAIPDAQAEGDDPFAGIEGSFDAVVSTHGFLHGTVTQVRRRLALVVSRLRRDGLFYATFGSTADARFGTGTYVEERTYAPQAGDERGVPHAFFDEPSLREALTDGLALERLEERAVDHVAGAWAHAERPLLGAVHWFAVARRT